MSIGTMGSLFDGSGGFPLAASMCGIEPRWASEIEPYPIAVTRARFPYMAHLGDITGINGAKIEPVDIITFGSPCQDMSIAGKRAGLKHKSKGDGETTRSGLFLEAVRIIKEMRDATNGKYPKYVLWENVPGAYTSNKGWDFLAVLQAIAEIAQSDIHVPRAASKGKSDRLDWKKAGYILGDGWSAAWRTLDAQYWGVPQRRRRIYLVADFTGERAGKILFERDGLSGDIKSCPEARQGAAEDAEGGVGRSNCAWLSFQLQQDPISSEAVAPCLSGQDQLAVYDARGNGDGSIVPTLTGDHQNRVTDYTAVCVGNGQLHNISMAEQANTLDCMHDQQAVLTSGKPPRRYIVRRLTPLECCRLQGFPDGWGDIPLRQSIQADEAEFWENVRDTHARATGKKYIRLKTKSALLKWYNKLTTDSAEYKMWGNGIALPCAVYVMDGIAQEIKEVM